MKNVVLVSGGMDSAVALAMATMDGPTLALSIVYGSKHAQAELNAAGALVTYYNCEHEIIQLPSNIFTGNKSALMVDSAVEVPNAEYQNLDEEGPSSTVVPFRNALFLSVATARAMIHDAKKIWIATHMSDYETWAYPDCSPEFLGGMMGAIYVGTMHKVRLITPFAFNTKAEIVIKAAQLKVPLQLTWSCYRGGEVHCGTCPTCLERIKAFTGAGYYDPVGHKVLTAVSDDLIPYGDHNV